jgi:RNA polymerase sigma factor (sigma-70 family)
MEKFKLISEKQLSDEVIISRVLKGEKDLYEKIMRKYNRRLFRIALSITGNENNIEDIMQQTYIKAYENLQKFKSTAAFSTWITRILINEALAYLKLRKREINLTEEEEEFINYQNIESSEISSPEETVMNQELKEMLERAISELPEIYRAVYMMREIESMSTAETAECLEISETNVKVRLSRARDMLKEKLLRIYEPTELFEFNLVRCDRIAANVMSKIKSY